MNHRSKVKTMAVGLAIAIVSIFPISAALADVSASQTELETVVLSVENMTCAMCPLTVRKSLEKVDGVKTAEVDYETKLAVVTFDPSVVQVSTLTHATTQAGYPSHVQSP